MTPEQLKASILQQAMEGKLVKQDPHEEPASVLFEKIKQHRNKLLQNGTIKKPRKINSISSEDEEYSLPSTWKWIRLGNILDVLTDGAHKSPKYTSSGVPFISVKDISSGYIDFENTKYVSEESHEVLSKRCRPQKNDLLLTKVGTTGIPVIVATDKPFDLFVSVALLRFDTSLININFLKYLIQSPLVQRQVLENTKGVGNQNWVLRDIANTLIVLPPLSEQKRIVAKIEKLMPLVDKYAESYNQLTKIDANFNDRMKQSILQYAMEGKLVKQDLHDEPASVLVKQITDEKARLIKEKKIKRTKKLPAITNDEKPFDIPDSWEWVHLDEISYSIGGKSNQIREKDSLATGKYKVVSQSQKKFIGFTNESSKVLSPQTDCIVFGDHTALVKYIDFNFVIGGDGVKVFKTLPGVSTMYLYYVLKYNLIGVAGLGGYSRHFKYIKDKLIPLPPLSEQKRIVDKIEQFMKLLDDKTL